MRLAPVALSFLYSLFRQFAAAIRIHRMDAAAKEAEILVLCHQLAVLQRRPRPDSWCNDDHHINLRLQF
jgi:hypothetical protein